MTQERPRACTLAALHFPAARCLATPFAFEVRFLGRAEAPSRAVIDLSKSDRVLLRPQSYFKIPNPEDRLFVPPEFVPLFASRGWQLEGFGP